MGWSYWVSCKSRKAADDMLAFLAEHYRDTMEVPDLTKVYSRGALSGRKSPERYFNSSAESSVKLGFYKPDEYQQAVLRWIAFRIGKRRVFKKKLGLGDAVPWVNFDGEQNVPVTTENQWDGRKQTKQYVVDAIGWQGVHRFWDVCLPKPEYTKKLAGWVSGANQKNEAIRGEIERLDRLFGFRVDRNA